MIYPIPSTKETEKLLRAELTKSARHRGRAALEAIKAKLEKQLSRNP